MRLLTFFGVADFVANASTAGAMRIVTFMVPPRPAIAATASSVMSNSRL